MSGFPEIESWKVGDIVSLPADDTGTLPKATAKAVPAVTTWMLLTAAPAI